MKNRICIVGLGALTVALLACAALQNRTLRQTEPAPAAATAAVGACAPDYTIAYRVMMLGGVKTGVWYPSISPEKPFSYSVDITTSLAQNGDALLGCGRFPLVIFSHGLTGCGVQSIFFTETLARKGYVVVAPDHHDALVCSVDGHRTGFAPGTEAPILDPKTWTDSSYGDRRDDVEHVLDAALQSSPLDQIIDPDRIGIAGHSLGGYTALGMVGGWPNWRDDRFKAALLLSPYTLPFTIHDTLKGVAVPLMYQGAVGDIGITPFVEGNSGAYAQSNPPKYFVKLRAGSHLTWTNFVCAGQKVVADCLQARPDAALIDNYGIAFFEMYVKGKPQSLLTAGTTALAEYIHQP